MRSWRQWHCRQPSRERVKVSSFPIPYSGHLYARASMNSKLFSFFYPPHLFISKYNTLIFRIERYVPFPVIFSSGKKKLENDWNFRWKISRLKLLQIIFRWGCTFVFNHTKTFIFEPLYLFFFYFGNVIVRYVRTYAWMMVNGSVVD